LFSRSPPFVTSSMCSNTSSTTHALQFAFMCLKCTAASAAALFTAGTWWAPLPLASGTLRAPPGRTGGSLWCQHWREQAALMDSRQTYQVQPATLFATCKASCFVLCLNVCLQATSGSTCCLLSMLCGYCLA
jgi:hypothetical protein